MTKREAIMRGYIIMDNTICQGDIVAGWVTIPRTDAAGHEVEIPEIYRTPKGAALSILDDRIDWLESRKSNVECLEDDSDDLLDECNGEASDDMDFWIEAIDIEGEGEAAVITWSSGEQTTLREASRNAGRAVGQPIQWAADGSDFSG